MIRRTTVNEQLEKLDELRVRRRRMARAGLEHDGQRKCPHERSAQAPGLCRRAQLARESVCLVEALARDRQSQPRAAERFHLPPRLTVEVEARPSIFRQPFPAPEAFGVAGALRVDQ